MGPGRLRHRRSSATPRPPRTVAAAVAPRPRCCAASATGSSTAATSSGPWIEPSASLHAAPAAADRLTYALPVARPRSPPASPAGATGPSSSPCVVVGHCSSPSAPTRGTTRRSLGAGVQGVPRRPTPASPCARSRGPCPLVALGLAVLPRRRASRPWRAPPAPGRRPSPPAVGVAVAVAGHARRCGPAAWSAANLERPEDVPDYWSEAAAYLDGRGRRHPRARDARHRLRHATGGATPSTRSRPGSSDRPYVARELIPYGSPPSADLLERPRPPHPGGARSTPAPSPPSPASWASATSSSATTSSTSATARPGRTCSRPTSPPSPGLGDAASASATRSVNRPIAALPAASTSSPCSPTTAPPARRSRSSPSTTPCRSCGPDAGDRRRRAGRRRRGPRRRRRRRPARRATSWSATPPSLGAEGVAGAARRRRRPRRHRRQPAPGPPLVDGARQPRLRRADPDRSARTSPTTASRSSPTPTDGCADDDRRRGDVRRHGDVLRQPDLVHPGVPARQRRRRRPVARSGAPGASADVRGERLEIRAPATTTDGVRFVQQLTGEPEPAHHRGRAAVRRRRAVAARRRSTTGPSPPRASWSSSSGGARTFDTLVVEVVADSSGRVPRPGRPVRFNGLTQVGFAEVDLTPGAEPSPAPALVAPGEQPPRRSTTTRRSPSC